MNSPIDRAIDEVVAEADAKAVLTVADLPWKERWDLYCAQLKRRDDALAVLSQATQDYGEAELAFQAAQKAARDAALAAETAREAVAAAESVHQDALAHLRAESREVARVKAETRML